MITESSITNCSFDNDQFVETNGSSCNGGGGVILFLDDICTEVNI